MKVRFSFWSTSIGNSYHFCKPHAENTAFNKINLRACLASFTFEAIQLVVHITFVNHTQKAWRSIGLFKRLSRVVYVWAKSVGDSYDSKTSPLEFVVFKSILNNYVLRWVYTCYEAYYFPSGNAFLQQAIFTIATFVVCVCFICLKSRWVFWNPVNVLNFRSTFFVRI